MKVEFLDSQRKEHGVQPVQDRPESARAASDRVLAEEIEQVHEDNYSVYGPGKSGPN